MSGAMSGSKSPGSAAYMRKIAAEDFYMRVCRAYSADETSPFGTVEVSSLSAALRDAFATECQGKGALPSRMARGQLLSVLRRFLSKGDAPIGSAGPYEAELVELLGTSYTVDGFGEAHRERAVDGTRLIGDFERALGDAAGSGTSLPKVELRRALIEWIGRASALPPSSAAAAPVLSSRASPGPPAAAAAGVTVERPALFITPPSVPPISYAEPSPTAARVSPPGGGAPLRSPPPPKGGAPRSRSSGRATAASLTQLIAQADAVARDNERQIEASDDAYRTSERALDQLSRDYRALDERHAGLHAELDAARREVRTLAEQKAALEVQLQQALNEGHTRGIEQQAALARETRRADEAIGRLGEREGQLGAVEADLSATREAVLSLREVNAEMHVEMDGGAARQSPPRIWQAHARLEEEHARAISAGAAASAELAAERRAHEVPLLAHAPCEKAASASPLPDADARGAREQAAAQNAREAAAHASELHAAALSHAESKAAASASQASVELEKLRAMMALEVQRSQQLVAEAKEETARARLECLQVHEQSLHIHEQTAVRHGRAKP